MAADVDIDTLFAKARVRNFSRERRRLDVPQGITRRHGRHMSKVVVRRRRRNRPLECRGSPGVVARDCAVFAASPEVPEPDADAENLEDDADRAHEIEALPALTDVIAID